MLSRSIPIHSSSVAVYSGTKWNRVSVPIIQVWFISVPVNESVNSSRFGLVHCKVLNKKNIILKIMNLKWVNAMTKFITCWGKYWIVIDNMFNAIKHNFNGATNNRHKTVWAKCVVWYIRLFTSPFYQNRAKRRGDSKNN